MAPAFSALIGDFFVLSAIQETENRRDPRWPPAEKAGATQEIQSEEEGGSQLKSARARKDFQSPFSRSLMGKKFLDMFWGSFGGVKMNSEK